MIARRSSADRTAATVSCGLVAATLSVGAVLSPAPDQDRCRPAGRRAARPPGARAVGQAVGKPQADRHRGQSRRRRRQPRGRIRRPFRSRWLHVAGRARHDADREPDAVQEPVLQSADGFAPAVDHGNAAAQMLVVHPSIPVNSVAEFVAYAKTNPVSYAHGGNGSPGHLTMELFRMMAGFPATPVPYRGNAQLSADLAAGQIKVGFVGPAWRDRSRPRGRLKGLATSSAERSSEAPEIPTIAEAGYDFQRETYFVLLAPAATPEPVHRADRTRGAQRAERSRSGQAVSPGEYGHRRLVRRRGQGSPRGRCQIVGQGDQETDAG